MTLTASQIAGLRQLETVWPDRPIVIIGAAALGFHYDMRWRETSDVDLIVAIELDEFPGPIAELDGWTQHPKKEHQFHSPQGAKIDILPAGPKLLATGHIAWPSGHKMNLEGMDLAFAYPEQKVCNDGYVATVASAATVVILKMASYCDRPFERERDLDDIAHLLEIYENSDSDRRWEEAIDQTFDLASAYLLGLDIGKIAMTPHKALIARFLARIGDPDSTQHALMQSRGPNNWNRENAPLQARIEALKAGLTASEKASNVLSDRRNIIADDEEFVEIMKIVEAPINEAAIAMLGALPPWEE